MHLGRPSANVQNVTVSFRDYIKNVASSEVYPTWPEQALRANIHAQISLALNPAYILNGTAAKARIFYGTSSTGYDQALRQVLLVQGLCNLLTLAIRN